MSSCLFVLKFSDSYRSSLREEVNSYVEKRHLQSFQPLNRCCLMLSSLCARNDAKNMGRKKNGIEKIDEAEFLMNLDSHPLSTPGSSTKKELDDGSDSEDKFSGEVGIEKIDEAEFRNWKRRSVSKRGSSMGQELTQDNKNIDGSDGEDTSSEEVGIEKIDEVEFMKHKTHSVSNIGDSTVQEQADGPSTATYSKNVDCARKNIVFINDLRSSPEDCPTDSDPMLDNKKGTITEYSSSKSIKYLGDGAARFKYGISSFASNAGSSTRKGEGTSKAKSSKNAEVVKDLPFNGCRGSFSSESAHEDSEVGQTDEPSSEKSNDSGSFYSC